MNLSFFRVALMYVGTIMGAGFASGREIWQFFGVFGNWGMAGVCLVAVLFILMGMMTAYIARSLDTNDMGRVIVPGGNHKLVALVGYFMAALLYTCIIAMSAAGGSLLNQLFGLPRAFGGILITILVIATVLGEFERVSRIFGYIMPVLFVSVVSISLMVCVVSLEPTEISQEVEPSPMASNWFLAALLYISYNMLGMIAVIATSAINSRSGKDAIGGAGLGGVFLGILAFVLIAALQKDMTYTQALDMPMLGFAGRISPVLSALYGVILFFAIYSAATSNFYAFTTKVKAGPKKKSIVILSAAAGFLLGLMGFKNVVAFMFPLEGFLGFIIIAMEIVNFFQVRKAEKSRNGFRNHDRRRFPAPLKNVTGGHGGDALLILGPEKTVLYDVGMCCFADKMIANVERELEGTGRKLDYVVLSHTHYDHMGGLPYVLKRWPDAEVCASAKAEKVFASEGARKTIEKMGKTAAYKYGVDHINIIVNPLRVDRILQDGDRINLGRCQDGQECWLEVLETRGHTDCALSYMVMPEKILLCCETCGVLISPEVIEVSAVKDFDESIEAAKRLKKMDFDHLYSQHYGMVPDWFRGQYFDLYIRLAREEKEFLENLIRKDTPFEEILEAHSKKYWDASREMEQPYEAYRINAEHEIRQVALKISQERSEI